MRFNLVILQNFGLKTSQCHKRLNQAQQTYRHARFSWWMPTAALLLDWSNFWWVGTWGLCLLWQYSLNSTAVVNQGPMYVNHILIIAVMAITFHITSSFSRYVTKLLLPLSSIVSAVGTPFGCILALDPWNYRVPPMTHPYWNPKMLAFSLACDLKKTEDGAGPVLIAGFEEGVRNFAKLRRDVSQTS